MNTYSESYRPWWCWLLVLISLVCVASLMGTWFGIFPADPEGELVALIALGFASLLLVAVAVVFSRYFVAADANLLTFGFSYWNVALPLDQIESIEATTIRPMQFGGLGWRMDRKRRIGYIVKGGEGVELTTKTGRVYVFNCAASGILVEQLSPAK